MNSKKLVLSFILVFCIVSAYADTTDDTEENTGLTHGQVLLYAGIPYIGTAAVVAASAFAENEDSLFNIIMNSSFTLLTIPHWIIDPVEGLGLTAVSAGSLGSSLLLGFYPELYGNQTISGFFSNISLKTCFWSYYRGYQKARKMANPGIYPYELEEVSFTELFASPWKPDILKMPYVWGPAATYALILGGIHYLDNQWQTAVWNTGRAYIGSTEVPVLLGLVSTIAVNAVSHTFTGIGEEALFRGIGYEEMKISLGLVPAKIIDAVIFPAIHIPQEIRAEKDFWSILFSFASRASITFALQWAYDEGGLKASVAQHMWIDVVSYTFSYLFLSGVPDNELALQLSFLYSY